MAKKVQKIVFEDTKLDIEVKKRKKPAKRQWKSVKIVIFIVVIIAVIYILTSSKTAEVTELKNYTVTKPVVETQPYTILEEYEETEPLGPPRCGNTQMNFTASDPWIYAAGNGTFVCAFNVTNLEAKEGTWEYRAYAPEVTGNKYDKETIPANSTITFKFVFDTPLSLPCGISVVSLPSIERCYFPAETFYKVVRKTRNVTRYKNVTTEKQVAFMNETTVTKTVSRFFGYPMIDFGW